VALLAEIVTSQSDLAVVGYNIRTHNIKELRVEHKREMRGVGVVSLCAS
jgi:hypothetical protein